MYPIISKVAVGPQIISEITHKSLGAKIRKS
jgi:hypothetical protein